MSNKFLAKQYIDAGWSIVPIVNGTKKAKDPAYQKKTYNVSDFDDDDGIAGRCGEPSGWRVDVDCDSPLAVHAAKLLLPATGLIHGRPGKPDSHYWYLCENATTHQFTDVKDSAGKTATLVELRVSGYTVLPPSRHHTGDQLLWTVERDPAIIKYEDLYPQVRNVALAALLAQHWPGPGGRHHMVGHLAGFLFHAKLPDFLILELIKVAATLANDADVHDRVVFAEGTLAKGAAGGSVTGGPKLAETLGEDVVAKMRGWLKMADTDAIEEMNQKYFVVRLGKDEVIGLEEDDAVVFQQPRSLAIRYANKQVPVGMNKKNEPVMKSLDRAWLESKARREFRSVVFAPPPCPVHEHDYNLWRGFAVKPSDAPCQKFLQHLLEVICSGNDDHFEYLINLLALTVQEPGTPSGVATVLRGKEGTGKGLFVRSFGHLFGKRHYTQLDKPEQLFGKFNAALSAKVVVFADEAFWAGDKRDLAALKRLITEPTLHIERKGVDGVDEANHIHLFMATNEEWAWPASMNDRRGLLLEVSDHRMNDFEYFSAIHEELNAGGYGGLLKYLTDWPIDHDLVKRIPQTAERQHQQRLTMSLELRWVEDCIRSEQVGMIDWPKEPECLVWNSIYQSYKIWMSTRFPKARPVDQRVFTRVVGPFLFIEQDKKKDGKPKFTRDVRLKNATSTQKCVFLKILVEARKNFETVFGEDEE